MKKNQFFAACSLVMLFAVITTPGRPQQDDSGIKIRQAQGKLASLVRDINFNTTDLKGIGRAIIQNRRLTDRLAKAFDVLQKQSEKFKKNVIEGQRDLANSQKILKELREKALSVTSEARQRAAEAQRLARSTDEIDRTVGLAKKLEAVIKDGESLLTTMQNQMNTVEVIAGGLAK